MKRWFITTASGRTFVVYAPTRDEAWAKALPVVGCGPVTIRAAGRWSRKDGLVDAEWRAGKGPPSRFQGPAAPPVPGKRLRGGSAQVPRSTRTMSHLNGSGPRKTDD